MGLFGNIFSSDNAEFWVAITSEEQIQEAIKASFEKPVVIFKHSTRCIISKTVLKNFEAEVNSHEGISLSFYFLDLLSFRAISTYLAEYLGVTHQSPQVIVLQNGKAVYDASHEQISLEDILNKIN